MGLYSVFLGLGQFLGSSLGGPFVDAWGMDGITYVTGLLGLFALILVFRLRKSERDNPVSSQVLTADF
jgi:predicted MFS family arabinose efflux permease